jgi:hypothetical protein
MESSKNIYSLDSSSLGFVVLALQEQKTKNISAFVFNYTCTAIKKNETRNNLWPCMIRVIRDLKSNHLWMKKLLGSFHACSNGTLMLSALCIREIQDEKPL